MLCSQGMEVERAVAEATKTVRKGGAMFRYAKPIDDCFWLASEGPRDGVGQMAAE